MVPTAPKPFTHLLPAGLRAFLQKAELLFQATGLSQTFAGWTQHTGALLKQSPKDTGWALSCGVVCEESLPSPEANLPTLSPS